MRVTRVGFTPVKGGRHQSYAEIVLAASGPVGDRAFCLVDLTEDRCLRTVENPTLLATLANWDGSVLTAELPTGRVTGTPEPIGEMRTVDYWGRPAAVELVEGPWAAAYSSYLGREVTLAASPPGEVVYGGAVSLIASASIDALSARVGTSVAGARFRATLEVDTEEPYAEEGWIGRRLTLGTAELRVRGLVPRCAVIDLHPETGRKDLPLLRALAAERQDVVGVPFGIDAEVIEPGVVRPGDEVTLR